MAGELGEIGPEWGMEGDSGGCWSMEQPSPSNRSGSPTARAGWREMTLDKGSSRKNRVLIFRALEVGCGSGSPPGEQELKRSVQGEGRVFAGQNVGDRCGQL